MINLVKQTAHCSQVTHCTPALLVTTTSEFKIFVVMISEIFTPQKLEFDSYDVFGGGWILGW